MFTYQISSVRHVLCSLMTSVLVYCLLMVCCCALQWLILQGLLCGVLQVVIQKLSERDAAKTGLLEKADPIMQALLAVFQCHATSVHEEAMLAVGALTYACSGMFTKYMQSFYPVLRLGLENHRVATHNQH